MKLKAFIAALALAVAGCASSPSGLEKPEYASSFQVDQPYQLTLQRIVQADRECQGGPLLPIGQVINDVQNYPDLREAEIIKGASGFGRQIYQVIKIREVGDDQSEVTLYTKGHRGDFLDRLQRWAAGDTGCDV